MPAPVLCPSCWARVPADSRTCPECGKPTTEFPKAAPESKAPPPLPPGKSATRSRPRDDERRDYDDRPRSRRRPVEEEEEPERTGSNVVLIGLLAGGALLVLVLAAGGAFLAFRGKSKPDDAVVQTNAGPAPAAQAVNSGPAPSVVPPVAPPREKPPAPPAGGNAIASVKNSTVYIRCTHLRGQKSSGTGFFAGPPGSVVTNAHVIGQMPPQSAQERAAGPVNRIEVVVHSGEPNEQVFLATVFGFDREHDLAMLRIAGDNLPPPLEFGNAAGLTETDEVLIFGYPFGEMLGKNISINRSTVSSLRRERGELAMVQLGGGMNPGNSGGPVTNKGGQVIGVSVAKILGADGIDFAIPAEKADMFVREQLRTGGVKPPEVAVGPPPIGPLGPPPVGPPMVGKRPRPNPGGVPAAPPQPPEPLTPTRQAPGGGPLPARVLTGDRPQMLGFGIGPEFKEAAPKDGVLVGLELGLNEDGNRYIVRQARAIYRVGDSDVFGEQQGNATGPKVILKAKAGYAVGALIVKHGLAVDGLSLVFMKVNGKRLDPKDSYESEWAGSSPPEMTASRLDGGGLPVVAMIGRADEKNLIAIATVFRGQEDVAGPFPPTGAKFTQMVGGGGHLPFQDTAPEGGLLVGFHFGMGKFVNNDVIKSIRPVYRVGDKEKLGDRAGNDIDRLRKVIAKPGYAVGAIHVRAGLGIDNVTVTFMKVVDGKLDPTDSYDSESTGGPGGGGPTKLGGDGGAVIGIVARITPKELAGLGLVVRKK